MEPRKESRLMTDPYSVTLSGGAPWGIRISGGREFGTPIILNHIVVNGKAHLGGIKTGIEFLSHMIWSISSTYKRSNLVSGPTRDRSHSMNHTIWSI